MPRNLTMCININIKLGWYGPPLIPTPNGEKVWVCNYPEILKTYTPSKCKDGYVEKEDNLCWT